MEKRGTLGDVSWADEGEQKAYVSQTNIPTFSLDTESDHFVEGRVNRTDIRLTF